MHVQFFMKTKHGNWAVLQINHLPGAGIAMNYGKDSQEDEDEELGIEKVDKDEDED